MSNQKTIKEIMQQIEAHHKAIAVLAEAGYEMTLQKLKASAAITKTEEMVVVK